MVCFSRFSDMTYECFNRSTWRVATSHCWKVWFYRLHILLLFYWNSLCPKSQFFGWNSRNCWCHILMEIVDLWRHKDVYLRCLRQQKLIETTIWINSLHVDVNWHVFRNSKVIYNKNAGFSICFFFFPAICESLHEVLGAWPQRAVWRPGDLWPKVYGVWCILRYVFMLYDNQIGITNIQSITISNLSNLIVFFLKNVLHRWGNGGNGCSNWKLKNRL